MEAVAKKHSERAVFLFVYCREAYPGGQRGGPPRSLMSPSARRAPPLPQASTAEERKQAAERFCADLKLTRRIILDDFGDKSLQRAYGTHPNPTIVIDLNGKIALKMAWTNAAALDTFLAAFLAKGGKYDAELAKSVPIKTPGMR
jgi:hypothetical protein